MLNQLDIDEFNFDELKNLKVEDVTKDVFVDFFKKCLNDDSKNTVLGWDSYIKKQIEINKIQTEVNGIFAGNMSGLKKFIGSMNTKNVDDLNKQEISELTENNDWKNFLSTEAGKRVTELLSEMQKIEQTNYEDKEESEDEKLKFVLQYVYDHVNEKNPRYSYNDATYKSDLLEILDSIVEKLNTAKLEKNKSVNPWYVNVLIGFLAITCTGFVWFVFGPAKDKKTVEDVASGVYKPEGEYDTGEDRDTGIDIIAGVFNVLISPLFVLSIIFAWAVAVQIILGIIFALLTVVGIVQVFRYEKDEFQRRKDNNEINLKNTEINSLKDTAQKIYAWLKQAKPNEELPKYQGLNLNIDDKDSTIPKLTDDNEKNENEPTDASNMP